MVKTLMKQIKEYKKDSLLTMLFAALEVILEIIIPLLMASLIDKGIEAGNMSNVTKYGTFMFVIAIGTLSLGFLAGNHAAKASTGFAANLRDAMYTNIQTFSFSNIDKYSTAGLVTRLTTDVTNVQMAYQMIIRMCIRAPMSLICALTMAMMINFRLSMIFVVAIVFLVAVLTIIMYHATKYFNDVFPKYDTLNESVQENVVGIRVVKSFVREKYENEKFKKAAQNIYKLFVKAESVLSYNNPAMLIAVYGSILMLSWLGAKAIVGGTLTTGELTSLFSYVMNIMMSLMMLSMVLMMLSRSVASVQRIIEVLEEEPDIKDPVNPITEVKNGEIEFRNVNFKYEDDSDENNLEGINIKIKAGETIGVIGSTGSGKSSLVQLIPRLYDATEGEVYVGGVNVKNYHIETLRNEVAMVLQKNTLFSGTIKENLMWGNENATDAEIEAAASSACVDEFIDRLPGRYDMHLEQGGVNVSGGQKQRLCIARAILKQPKVLILDDSTSAVDTATDAKIRKAFAEDLKDTTKIIIAQRVNSVSTADKIIVMDDGKISAIGTHDELMESSEIYKDVYKSQQEGVGLRE